VPYCAGNSRLTRLTRGGEVTVLRMIPMNCEAGAQRKETIDQEQGKSENRIADFQRDRNVRPALLVRLVDQKW